MSSQPLAYIAIALAVILLGAGMYILAQRAQIEKLRADAAICGSRAAALESRLDRQNAEVNRIAKECKAKSRAADLAAVRAINAPPKPLPGSGPQHLNAWFAQRLSQD